MTDTFLADIQAAFLEEATELLQQAESSFLSLERDPENTNTLDNLFRLAHNFKGSGKAVGFDGLSRFAHQVENLLVALKNHQVTVSPQVVSLLLRCGDQLKNDLVALRSNSSAVLNHGDLEAELELAQHNRLPALSSASEMPKIVSQERKISQAPVAQAEEKKHVPREDSVRVRLDKIDNLLDLFGEQVILQNILEHSKYTLEQNADVVRKSISQLNKLTLDLQQTVISLRMVNLKGLSAKLERAVRDTANALGKKVRFETVGVENELDKTIVDALSDSLVHMVRNSVDHGIESPTDRTLIGKDEEGTIELSASRKGGAFYIQISDNGKGLDPERILTKARACGLVDPNTTPSPSEIFNLIFENGLSTKDSATDFSGRGVGMNVVQETIQMLKGSISIDSTVGQGTRFTIRLPLSLALFNGLVVMIHGQKYVVSSSDVVEILALDESKLKNWRNGGHAFQLRDRVIDVVDLRSLFKRHREVSAAASAKPTLLVMQVDGSHQGWIVDQVLVQQKMVHKAIREGQCPFAGSSGATILGDGSVALILDPAKVLAEKAHVSGIAA